MGRKLRNGYKKKFYGARTFRHFGRILFTEQKEISIGFG
jgi:hypothetical protein